MTENYSHNPDGKSISFQAWSAAEADASAVLKSQGIEVGFFPVKGWWVRSLYMGFLCVDIFWMVGGISMIDCKMGYMRVVHVSNYTRIHK